MARTSKPSVVSEAGWTYRKIVSIDLGTTTAKAAALMPDGSIKTIYFPSSISEYDINAHYDKVLDPNFAMGYNGQWLVYGDQAQDFAYDYRMVIEPQDSGRYTTDAYLKLALFAVFKLYGEFSKGGGDFVYQNADINVVLSVPPGVQKSNKTVTEISTLIAGRHTVTDIYNHAFNFKINAEILEIGEGIAKRTQHRGILVVPEGAGAAATFVRVAMDKKLPIANGTVVIVDIGGQTADVFGTNNGNIITALSDSLPQAGLALSRLIDPENMRAPGTLRDRVVYMNNWIAKQNGSLPNNKYVKSVGEQIVGFVSSKIQKAGVRVDAVILFGGYAPVFLPAFKANASRFGKGFSQSEIGLISEFTGNDNDLYMANATGALSIGYNVFEERSKV